MAILRASVQAFMLALLHTGQQLLFGCCIPAQFIGDQYTRDVLTSVQQLAKELVGGLFVRPALDQDIEHISTLINCWPELVQLASDLEKDRIKMPFVAGLCTPAT